MADQEQDTRLGRHLANIPLLVQQLTQTAVRSEPPIGKYKVKGVYFDPDTKELVIEKE